MKNVLTIVLSAVVGAITALLFQRAAHATESARRSRPLEAIAPMYKEMVEKYTGDDQLYSDHQKAWIKFVREAVQPNLTELEAEEVAQAVLNFHPPAYNYNPPIMPSWEKTEDER